MEQNEEKVVSAEKKQKNVKNLIVAGLLSALAGLAGCLLLGLLMSVGFVASISGIVISLAMYYTFQKFYKTKSKWLYVYIVGVAIIEIFLTVLIADGIIIMSMVLASENIIISLGEAINFIFSEGELVGAFLSDFLLAVLFALIGMGFVIYSIVQTEKRKQVLTTTINTQNTNKNTVFTPATVVEKDEQKSDNKDENQSEYNREGNSEQKSDDKSESDSEKNLDDTDKQ